MEKKEKVSKKINSIANKTKEKTKAIGTKAKTSLEKTKNKAIETMDVNGDGSFDIEDVIVMGLRTPGIKISREQFLKKELKKKFSEEVIEKAIETNPCKAGIEVKEIDKIADQVIKFERNCVSGISAVLSAPVGPAMAVTIPTEIVQYYGYMLRATQKLMYLYGFPEINVEEKEDTFDSETINILIVCLGTMYGVAGANKAIKVMANGLGQGMGKKFMRANVQKTIYPIIKNILKWFNFSLTKEVSKKAIENAVPVVGMVIGGTITFATFKPCCDRLKKSLQNTILSNPNYIKENEDVIEVDAKITNEDN